MTAADLTPLALLAEIRSWIDLLERTPAADDAPPRQMALHVSDVSALLAFATDTAAEARTLRGRVEALEGALSEALEGWSIADAAVDQEFRISSDPPCEDEIAIERLYLVLRGEVRG